MIKSPSRRNSIAARLTWMNVLVCGIGLFLAYFSFLAYDLYVYRQGSIENLSGVSKVVGSSSVSAIIFNDDSSAQTTLSALGGSSDIVAAAIYTNAGTRFAQFVRDGETPPVAWSFSPAAMQHDWLDGLDIVIGSRIQSQGKPIGTVYIHARLHGLRNQAIQYATIAAGILLLCLGAALLLGIGFRRDLAEPIVSLAKTARQVSRSRDYSLRFNPHQEYDELLSLTDAFNEMLGEIQLRDLALEQAKVGLELRVEERTAQLRAANRELEAFSYTVAHDLRSPLQAINNVCFLLEMTEKGESSAERRSILTQLSASLTAMSNMIDDLLDLSRSTSAELHLTKLDLSPLVSSILEGLAKTNPDRHVKSVIHPHCEVLADPGLMQVMMQNLLRNAWKFTGRRELAEIEFGCLERADAIVIYVRDNGAGFNPQLADRLFKPFQRLHGAADFPGTGIGLATVRRIVSRHGGEIWAEGEVDKGATFYFTLNASPK
jgi:light-regulated signal transduction histidine kinase (bacteriophytochrome)